MEIKAADVARNNSQLFAPTNDVTVKVGIVTFNSNAIGRIDPILLLPIAKTLQLRKFTGANGAEVILFRRRGICKQSSQNFRRIAVVIAVVVVFLLLIVI